MTCRELQFGKRPPRTSGALSGTASLLSGMSVERVGNRVPGEFPTTGGHVGSPCREDGDLGAPGTAQPLGRSDSASPDARGPRYRTGRPSPAERVRLGELGAMLRSRREALGLTLADLEPVAGSRGSLADIEAGRIRTRPSRLRAWLGALGVYPEPILASFADVIAPENPRGPTWSPVNSRPPASPPPPRQPAPLPAHLRAVLGAELWLLRVRAGLGRKELAHAVGRSRPWVSIAERGLRAIDPEHLERWLVVVEATASERVLLALRFPGWIRARREDLGVGMAPPDQSRRSPTGRFVAKEQEK